MEVSMSKTRRGKYTDNRICYISKCKGDMRLYLRRKGKLPCFSYLVRGKSFSFYRGKVRKNNEECLILHVFNSSECLILHVSGYSERLHQFIEDHIKQVAISLLRKISMTWCIGVWITLDSKLHLQKAPLSALFAYFPASAFSSYLFPAQKSFFEKKYQNIII